MPTSNPPVIEFDRVSVYRGSKNALTDISFKIRANENVAFLGPNGSGKSTLIKTIARELYPTRGAVKIFGKEVWDVFSLRSQLGIVSYDLQALFQKEITVQEAVISGFFNSVGLWKNNRVTPEMKKKAADAMARLGILPLKNQTMRRLSSGEIRRVMIARALIHRPKMILFDEPMNSLDLGAQALVKDSLRKCARSGVGIMLVTHHLSDIIPEIDRVILLNKGRIAADGKKQTVLTASNLARLFGPRISMIQQKGYFHAIS